ncbi:hypothetical protein HanIR_Chr03g0128451 [Helianthus annuus]|nr:hypothetical protein HanIR_Chr03g0128451 [Helianthus annuus]
MKKMKAPKRRMYCEMQRKRMLMWRWLMLHHQRKCLKLGCSPNFVYGQLNLHY